MTPYQDDFRLAYDLLDKIFSPLKERIDNNTEIMQKIVEKLTDMNSSLNEIKKNINDSCIDIDTHANEFKSWKNKILTMMTLASILFSIVCGMIIELRYDIKDVNKSAAIISSQVEVLQQTNKK